MIGTKLMDSSVWIAYFFNGHFSELLETQELFFLSVISLYEIKKKLQKEKIDPSKISRCLAYLKKKSFIVPLDEPLTDKAVEVAFHHNLAFADSVIYATSFSHGVTLYTLDNDFRNIPHVEILSVKKGI